MKSVKEFLKQFYEFSPKKIFLYMACTLSSAILEGISLLLLVPFLSAAGMGPSAAAGKPAFDEKLLVVILLLFLLITIIEEFIKRSTSILMIALKAGFYRALSDRFYEAFACSRWQVILKQRRSDIANALTNELKTIDIGTQISLQTFSTIPSVLIQIVVAFVLSWQVTLAAIACGILFFHVMKPVNRKLGDIAESLNNVLRDSLSDVNEHLGGIKEIKGYSAEKVHSERYQKKTRRTEEQYVQFIRTFSTSNFIYNTATIIMLAIFIYGAVALFHESVVKLIVLSIVFFRIWPLFATYQTSLQFFIMMIPAWESFSNRMRELEEAREESMEKPGTEPMVLQQGIEVKDVTFSYNQEEIPTLRHVSLSIPAHSFVAVTGLSGSGKSTFVDILLGLLEPSSGEVTIDGETLNPAMAHLWRSAIGFVPQDTFLFNGTVRENLLWSRPSATDEEIMEALKLAAADDFVKALPQSLDTECGDRGTRFSGGERQRIALARALLRSPSLLVLDEATSSLDTENEKRIIDAIKSLHGKMTILIVAHRLSTIREADEIVLFENGSAIEKGTFGMLMERENGRFHDLAREYAMK
ncbi:MAG: ABC transporter ATP-binding protein [Candidatus Eremiobacteraeota bacterium]|nr:ABC transporter ATP-binding protein [Candidatus Eremiobacteraeota bacterium]